MSQSRWTIWCVSPALETETNHPGHDPSPGSRFLRPQPVGLLRKCFEFLQLEIRVICQNWDVGKLPTFDFQLVKQAKLLVYIWEHHSNGGLASILAVSTTAKAVIVNQMKSSSNSSKKLSQCLLCLRSIFKLVCWFENQPSDQHRPSFWLHPKSLKAWHCNLQGLNFSLQSLDFLLLFLPIKNQNESFNSLPVSMLTFNLFRKKDFFCPISYLKLKFFFFRIPQTIKFSRLCSNYVLTMFQ